MAQHGAYKEVIVETYREGGGITGIHVRPAAGQPFPQSLRVECSKRLITDYPVGTRFKITAKLTDRQGEGEFLYSSYRWKFEVVR